MKKKEHIISKLNIFHFIKSQCRTKVHNYFVLSEKRKTSVFSKNLRPGLGNLMAQLVVCVQSFKVLLSKGNVLTVLGHDPKKLIGQSILNITGARSNPQTLQQAIEGTHRSKVQLILYDACGGERRLIVSCCISNDSCAECQLTVYPSEAIMLHDAFSDCLCASALVSAENPHPIHMANELFCNHFECIRSEILGRPLHLFGLRCLGCGTFDEWLDFLSIALDGRVARKTNVTMPFFRCEVSVTIVPVVEAPNGGIRHLLLTIGAQTSRGYAGQLTDGCLQQNASRESGLRTRRPPHLLDSKRKTTANDSHLSDAGPRLHKSGPAIFPRRKAGSIRDSTLAAPVVVTEELVAALAHLPLSHAAATVGVSPTAFKKACRRLGVIRWAYKRFRPLNTTPRAAEGNLVSSGEDQAETVPSVDEQQAGGSDGWSMPDVWKSAGWDGQLTGPKIGSPAADAGLDAGAGDDAFVGPGSTRGLPDAAGLGTRPPSMGSEGWDAEAAGDDLVRDLLCIPWPPDEEVGACSEE